MKGVTTITITALLLVLNLQVLQAQSDNRPVRFAFCGKNFDLAINSLSDYSLQLSPDAIKTYYKDHLAGKYPQVVAALREYKTTYKPDDWLFYQLVRQTANQISPKANNYLQYTLYKWFFLTEAGYDAIVAVSANKVLFYIQCDENIYNIPTRILDNKQYVCLNYHDYININFLEEKFQMIELPSTPGVTFSYKVSNIPDFKATQYLKKDLHFSYYENDYHFKVKLSPQVQSLFKNYPVTDYDSYLNIPLSKETYNSIIPQLKRNIRGMSTKNGVDYLMRFTRYAFLFEPDSKRFGGEKRLSPEQTLFNDQSDCEDRVALFFYLVKEMYNLPMIVLAYPNHVTVAVEFEKPIGHSIVYKGKKYSVCEPTPQKYDLQIGETLPELNNSAYEIAYTYQPK